jgi:hypothetical protein
LAALALLLLWEPTLLAEKVGSGRLSRSNHKRLDHYTHRGFLLFLWNYEALKGTGVLLPSTRWKRRRLGERGEF